ncbi:MAG: amidohydrolase family protein [Thaumarchaeota archaeon]|nr:amidohydrolase family protein [Nitrososphaerota archaeon]
MILRNCNVVDVREGTIRPNVSIRVEGKIIQSITPGSPTSGELTKDLSGAYVLPGLINAHVHLYVLSPIQAINPHENPAETALRCYSHASDALKAGVTTVRTVGELNRVDIALRSMITKGWVQGPRIVSAGRGVTPTGGHGAGLATEADGPDGFRRAAREDFAAGADHIKLFVSGGIANIHDSRESLTEPQATLQEMEAAVSVASSKGTYVCAHATGSEIVEMAAEAGVRSFEHCYELNKDAVDAIRSVNGFLVPTLSVTSLPPEYRRKRGFSESTIDKMSAARPKHLESVRAAVRAGVKVVVGTDTPPGNTSEDVNVTVKETEFLVEAGMSPLEAVRSATLNAAELIMMEDRLGLVEPRYQADLVAMPSNPLEDIKNLRKIAFVMYDGQIIRDDLRPSD